MLSLLRLERKRKHSSNPFRIRIFLFLSYSFRTEVINTFIHSVVPSKTIPGARPKWAKCIPVFIPKRRKNPTRWGGKYGNPSSEMRDTRKWLRAWLKVRDRGEIAARVWACTLSPQKFKYQHVVWRNPTKRIRKYSNDFRDTVYTRQHVHLRFTYMLLYEIYCGLRKF